MRAMQADRRHLFLLGPQPKYESLQEALRSLDVEGDVALISAGWEEDESQDGEIRKALPHDVVNLELFKRSEQLFHDDSDLIRQLRCRQDQLRSLRDVYRMRIDHGLQAARALAGLEPSIVDHTQEFLSAIEAVRQLDEEYLQRTSDVCEKFESLLNTWDRPLVKTHRDQLQERLKSCGAILISGGNVGIILNRLRIFGVLELRPDLPLAAWSGGAMALSSQIVFFHDSPPQGKGDPEVFRAGLGIIRDMIPFPDAEHRLDLNNEARVSLLARRFESKTCLALDESSIVELKDGNWSSNPNARVLSSSGAVERFPNA